MNKERYNNNNFFWSPTEDYRVTVWWIWFVFFNYQVSAQHVGRELMRWNNPMKELSSELSSPSDPISGHKSSQCWINVSQSNVCQNSCRFVKLVLSECWKCWISVKSPSKYNHDRSQTLKSDEAKWSKLTRITPVGSFLGGKTHEFEKIRRGHRLVCLYSSYGYDNPTAMR